MTSLIQIFLPAQNALRKIAIRHEMDIEDASKSEILSDLPLASIVAGHRDQQDI